MSLTRRSFGLAALSLPLAAAAASSARAEAHSVTTGGAAVYSAPLGDYQITAIMDGVVPLGRGFFSAPDEGAIDAILDETGTKADVLPAPVNTYLLSSADRKILIDAGLGGMDAFGPNHGRLTAGLAALGVAPKDIDTVVVTHLHPDHIGGLMGQAPTFPNAEIVVAEAELAFWTDAAMEAAAPEGAKGLFQMAKGLVGLYGDQITQVGDGAEIAPGLSLTSSPGHTPGHSVLRIDGGDRQLLMVADTLHNTDLHTALPDIAFGFDTDTGLAAQSRRKIFDMAAADKLLIAGSHIHFPGFGRIVAQGDAYRFVPATWV